MSRFVNDEDADIQTGSEASGLKNPETLVQTEVKPTEQNEEGQETKTKYRRRKTLQEQLLNNRNYKYRERKKKLEKQNSSFKMKKDTREFYGRLDAEKDAKKLREKETFDREMDAFRRKKLKQEKQKEKEASKKVGAIQEEAPAADKPKLVAYSDSDSE